MEETEIKKEEIKTKFCKFCGEKIAEDAVMCTHCGRQVETLKNEQPSVVINNTNSNANANVNNNINNNGGYGKQKNKWVALMLCIFLGWLGAHKFYEEKVGMGILYLLTLGFWGIGILIDFIVLLFKPNPYYV